MRTLSTSPFLVNGSTVISRITRVREGNLCFSGINSEYLANRAARVPQAGARIGEHQRDRSENNKEQNHCNDNVVDPIL
jgi:hypothetical protein